MSYRITCHEQDGRLVMRYSGDAQGLVDACAKEANDNARLGRFQRPKDLRKIMSIDPVVLMELERRTGLSFLKPGESDELIRMLKDRDYKRFHTVSKF